MNRFYHFVSLAGLSIIILSAGGCATKYNVKWVPNQSGIALTAEDVVIFMDRAGFSEKEILELGSDVRNGLASTGAVRAYIDENTAAIISTDGRLVYVNSRERGSFVYDPESKIVKESRLMIKDTP